MTPAERRASGSLATIFAARMLGLFLVLPVFALEAARYPGGNDPALIGMAMGIYGLTQGVLQLPYGMASDRFGRKLVIVLGLLVFAAGSFVAAAAPDQHGLIIGRGIQGAGAVSAAVTALLADQTRDIVRTQGDGDGGRQHRADVRRVPGGRADVVGAHRAARPVPVTGLLALFCSPSWCGGRRRRRGSTPTCPRGRLSEVLGHAALMRLNVGVFVLHAVQLSMWVVVPSLLVRAGLPKGPPLAGLPAHRAGLLLRPWAALLIPAGAARLPAGGVPELDRAGAAGAVGLWAAAHTRRGPDDRADVRVLCGFNVLERPPSPACARGWRPPRPAVPRSVCTTPCNRWDFLPAARSAAGCTRPLEREGCSPPAPS